MDSSAFTRLEQAYKLEDHDDGQMFCQFIHTEYAYAYTTLHHLFHIVQRITPFLIYVLHNECIDATEI